MTRADLETLNKASHEYSSARAVARYWLRQIDAEMDALGLEGDHRQEIRRACMAGDGADVDMLTDKIITGVHL